MKLHLTEDILIQYQFDLLDATRRSEVVEHLDDCEECRRRLQKLRRKFSVLDTLDAEEAISDQLVQKTIASIHEAKVLRPFAKRAWIWPMTIAAGLILAAGALFVGQNYWKKSVPMAEQKTLGLMKPEFDDSLAAKSDKFGSLVQSVEPQVISEDQIPDRPPFAPASAVELVVLPNPDKMQVTIYNSADLTLVRDTRKLTLKAGWNWLQFMWAETQIDPTSLSLRPLEYADKIDVQQLVYPARLKDIGRWLIRSEVEGAVPFEITYFTSGLTWEAFYEGTISSDEKTMQLKSYVRVQNDSGQDYRNTQTRLIVGKVHLLDEITILAGRQYPYGPEVEDGRLNWKGRVLNEERNYFFSDDFRLGDKAGIGGAMAVGYDIKKIEKEGLSEYFLYTIEGTEDLPNQWAKCLPSLDASDIPIKSLYKYDEDRYGTQTIRFVSFVNDSEHKLGTTPLPDGNVKLYRQLNAQRNLTYVGRADIKYIPVNEEVELNLGTDSLVKVETVLMDSRTENYMFNDKGDITGWDEIESWQIKLTNTRDIPADFEVTRNFNTDSWDIKFVESDFVQYKKHDSQRARFNSVLQAQMGKSFQYIVTKYCGIRKDVKMRQSQ